MTKRKWVNRFLLACAIIFVVFLLSLCLSIRFFNSINPVRSLIGVSKILWTDTPYVKVQDFSTPRYLIKSGNFTSNYQKFVCEVMEVNGFIEMPEKQMGSLRCFENGKDTKYISIQGNKYYMRCGID